MLDIVLKHIFELLLPAFRLEEGVRNLPLRNSQIEMRMPAEDAGRLVYFAFKEMSSTYPSDRDLVLHIVEFSCGFRGEFFQDAVRQFAGKTKHCECKAAAFK